MENRCDGTTEYSDNVDKLLRPVSAGLPSVLDLFAGAGGLALGFESVGFGTEGYERDPDCVRTYETNLSGTCRLQSLELGFDYSSARVVIGGPPCQPFSVGGKQKGSNDNRDGLPIFIDAVRSVDPDIWMFENVRGLLYRNKHYFGAAIDSLRKLGYIIEWRLLTASRFGVPQKRERLFVIGHRGKFEFPRPQFNVITAGQALGNLAALRPENAKYLTESMDRYVARYEKASQVITPRDLHLDRPSRTLTTRNLAGATGDMMRVKLPTGQRRRLTIREAARLQSFPDWFEFAGSEGSQFQQIGNAVPPLLARELAMSVRDYLSSSFRVPKSELITQPLVGQMQLV